VPSATAAACAADAECDDANVCTQDACGADGRCVHTGTSLPIAAAAVEVRGLDKPGKAVLSLRAEVVAVVPLSPAPDPARDGLRIQLLDVLGNVRDALTLPPGRRDATSRIGWSTNRTRLRWHYADRTGTGRVRTADLVVNDETGRIGVRLSASGGTLPLTVADAPFGIRVLVDAAQRRCGALTFNATGGARPICKFSRSGTSVQCR